MSEIKRPLEGIKVVELATFIAAPCCARFLADLGAEVIKIEAPAGDPLRYTAVNEGRPQDQKENTTYDLENANKTCIALNTKSAAGREALEKLIAGADICITNWRQNPLKKAGLDYDTLHAKYPALVYGFVSGYGEKGPDKDLPGFDFTAFFARGGVLGTLFDKDSLPMLTIAGFGDHQVGLYLASGVLAALYRAKQTGQGIPSDSFWAYVSVTKGANAKDATVLLASYDRNGQYLGLTALEADVPCGTTYRLGAWFANADRRVAKVKAFVVDGVGTMRPLAAAAEIS